MWRSCWTGGAGGSAKQVLGKVRRQQQGGRLQSRTTTTTRPTCIAGRPHSCVFSRELSSLSSGTGDQQHPRPQPPGSQDDMLWQDELRQMQKIRQSRTRNSQRQQWKQAISQRNEGIVQDAALLMDDEDDVDHMQQRQPPDLSALRLLSKEIVALQERVASFDDGNSTTAWKIWETPPPPSISSTSIQQQRQQVFADCCNIVKQLGVFLENKTIRPDSKHRNEFSIMTEHLLQIFWKCGTVLDEHNKHKLSVYDQCQKVLEYLKLYNYELTHKQCDYCVTVAAREGRWTEAADLYSSHIDPDLNGFLPVTSSADMTAAVNGLYCIAQSALQQDALPVENVFTGVRNLSMVSPSDAEKYVLAAGAALGYAGEYKSLKNYLESSYKSFELGQPLVAAVMHACIICNEFDDAIAMFDRLVGGDLAAAEEWQWGGGQYKLHPACRDLAIRALGGRLNAETYEPLAVKKRVLELYNQSKEENCRISIAALCAIVRACERARGLEDAIGVFLAAMDDAAGPDGVSMFLASRDNLRDLELGSELQQSPNEVVAELGVFLDHVMRACNALKQFGVALLSLRLFELAISSSDTLSFDTSTNIVREELTAHSAIVQSLLPVICSMRNAKDVLRTVMAALCGIGSPHEATGLFEAASPVIYQEEAPDGTASRDKHDVYAYAVALRDASPPKFNGSWDSVHRHIHRLTAAFLEIEKAGEPISGEDKRMLSSALSTAIRECGAISQPETGITLGKWVERRKIPTKAWAEKPPPLFALGENEGNLQTILTDPLLAAAIEVFSISGKLDKAEFLIQTSLGNERPPAEWSLSYHEAMKALFAQRQHEDGMALFRAIVSSVGGNPTIFTSAAKGLKASGQLRPIIELYRHVLSSGCFSEELSLLAMQAVASSGRGRPMPFLRSIIGEIAKAMDTDPASWAAANYWTLKRYLRYDAARLLMGWDDYKTSHLDELELALETLERRSKAGLTPKTAALFTIVKAAANYEQMRIPFNKTGVPRVPRDSETWIKILKRVLHEAKDTSLLEKSDFIDETAVALRRLGCNAECVELVTDAMSRGVILHKAALQSAYQSAESAGMSDMTGDIEMLLAEAS